MSFEGCSQPGLITAISVRPGARQSHTAITYLRSSFWRQGGVIRNVFEEGSEIAGSLTHVIQEIRLRDQPTRRPLLKRVARSRWSGRSPIWRAKNQMLGIQL